MGLALRDDAATRPPIEFRPGKALGIADFALNDALFDHASDAIALLTPEGIVLDVNRRWEDIRGIPRRQLIGQHIREFSAAGSEDLNATKYRRALAGKARSEVGAIAAANGSRLYMEFTTAVIPAAAGNVLYLRSDGT